MKEFGKGEDKEIYNLPSSLKKHIHMCVILFPVLLNFHAGSLCPIHSLNVGTGDP
jgi:hypothetical protein